MKFCHFIDVLNDVICDIDTAIQTLLKSGFTAEHIIIRELRAKERRLQQDLDEIRNGQICE